ncbi:C39 family peptidase [Micromonospora aurantiaca (nom. illeg.)]|uniref:C39 family peptidase n=1 Tax=Micromonospora aurantiaca (nom. illeg.) TaxID=47850 RepID=UPI0037099682
MTGQDEALRRRAQRLAWLIIGWDIIEGAVAVTAGLVASSIALLGFGIDSTIESSPPPSSSGSCAAEPAYRTHMIPGAATPARWTSSRPTWSTPLPAAVPLVANIVGSATDTDGGWHSFPGGHYIAVVGYKDDGRTVRIADSANPATASYWMTTIDLANWMATRGYSA